MQPHAAIADRTRGTGRPASPRAATWEPPSPAARVAARARAESEGEEGRREHRDRERRGGNRDSEFGRTTTRINRILSSSLINSFLL
uniref:Uncharacterized protein n=1 Tax=Oryza barthii TaxID=65489 RepID=A0A0D3FS28_9ORYZ